MLAAWLPHHDMALLHATTVQTTKKTPMHAIGQYVGSLYGQKEPKVCTAMAPGTGYTRHLSKTIVKWLRHLDSGLMQWAPKVHQASQVVHCNQSPYGSREAGLHREISSCKQVLVKSLEGI